MRTRTSLLSCLLMVSTLTTSRDRGAGYVPGTSPLTGSEDIASRLVDGVDRSSSARSRRRPGSGRRSGSGTSPRPSDTTRRSSPTGSGWPTSWACAMRACRSRRRSWSRRSTGPRWSARARGTTCSPCAGRPSATCTARGCCSCRRRRKPVADVVAIPDADQTPEQIAGLVAGRAGRVAVSPAGSPRAAAGCSCPTLIDRDVERARPGEADEPRVPLPPGVRAGPAPDRLRGAEGPGGGRLVRQGRRRGDAKIGVIGCGEGGCSPSYAAALDPRIDAVVRQRLLRRPQRASGQEPIDRNVFGLLEQFGDAELAEPDRAPGARSSRPRRARRSSSRRATGGGPGRLVDARARRRPGRGRARPQARRRARARRPGIELVVERRRQRPVRHRGSAAGLARRRWRRARARRRRAGRREAPAADASTRRAPGAPDRTRSTATTSALLVESPTSAQAFMTKLDTSRSRNTRRRVEPYRELLRRRGDRPLRRRRCCPPNVRTRQGLRRAESTPATRSCWTSSPT